MLTIHNVSKTYKKSKTPALNNVSFEIKEGEFTALLGQNGAGKSTLINILAGNVKKDTGTVSIAGHDLDTDELLTKKVIGIVPQELTFEHFFTVQEVMDIQSGYFGIKNNREYTDELLATLNLYDKRHAYNRTLSGGMKRRLLIAKALVHKPRIFILDEPTAGVDIELRHSLYSFLQELHKKGITIILTTHYLEEAEKLCDRVLVINQGTLIADDSKQSLMDTIGNESVMEFHFDDAIRLQDFNFIAEYAPEIVNDRVLQVKVAKDETTGLMQKLFQSNIRFNNFNLTNQRLEDVYLKLINNAR